MDIFDAQVHVFYTLQLDETIAVMNALGIQSVIIDEFWAYTKTRKAIPNVELPNGVLRPVSPLAQAAALQYPERFSILQRVERLDSDLPAVFAILGSTPGCRAIRITTRDPVERKALADGGYDELLKLAQRHDLAVSVLGNDIAAPLRAPLARFPGVNFVLDHCGSPESPAAWDNILALGKFSNAWLKWSHGHHFFDAGPYPYAGLQTQLARALNAFGKERVIWASDFTHNRTGATWAELLFYLRESANLSQGDKEWLFSRAARTLYRWPAPTTPAVAPHVARLPFRPVIAKF